MAFSKVQNLLIDDKKNYDTSLPEFVFNSALNYGTNIVLYLVPKV